MTLTTARRRKNRQGLLDVLGVPPDGTIVRSPLTAGPHADVSGGPGFLEVGSELMEVDMDDLEELTEDVAVRAGLSPRSPGYGSGTSTSYVPPAPENTPEGRAARERERRRGIASEVLLGRTSAGTKGDVDAGGLGVSEAFEGDYAAAVSGHVATILNRGAERADRDDAARSLIRLELAAGIVTEAEAAAALEALSGRPALAEGVQEGSGRRAGLAAAERLAAVTERVCGCSAGGDPEDRRGGCGAACGMAARNLGRRRAALGLREETSGSALRDWTGDLAG